MAYHYLAIEKRACIYQFNQLGRPMREITKSLNRNAATISRELKRNIFYTNINYSIKKYSNVKINILPGDLIAVE